MRLNLGSVRVYFDNMLITYLANYEEGRPPVDHLRPTVDALVAIVQHDDVEILVSEETLIEIGRMDKDSSKRMRNEPVYRRLKAGNPVHRNAGFGWSSKYVGWWSEDVGWDHDGTNEDLDRVEAYLVPVGNVDDMDPRYIANAMLADNAIDVFLTYDKKTIWRHRAEIKERFGETVMTPEELLQQLP